MSLTSDEHKARHKQLHKAFDELLADWMHHHPDRTSFLNAPVSELMRWSFEQTQEPTEIPEQ